MKVKENINVYCCDFCKKKLFIRQAMERHEERCHANPINFRPCFNCIYLERQTIEYDSGVTNYHTGETIYRNGEAFYCSRKIQFMLHPKLRFKKNSENLRTIWFKGDDTEQLDMPLSCREQKTDSIIS